MNGLAIGIITFFILMVLAGMHNGLIRCVFGIVAFLASVIISFVITGIFNSVFDRGRAAAGICFLVVFLVAYVAMLVVAVSLNIIASLPVLSAVNRIGGAILGAVLGLLCVWIFMAVIGVLASNGQAMALYDMIQESEGLKILYDNNIIDMLLQEHLWPKLKEYGV